jgi:hypothetical protein
MMAGLAKRLHPGRSGLGRPGGGSWAFAAKVIGIGLCAGLMLVYCQVLLDACFRGLH